MGALATPSGPDGAQDFLSAHGAGEILHPGGTLLAHLIRVRDLLAAWGARPALQAAGLCHAVYGTDGFPTALVALTQRPDVADLVGVEAEALIYLYDSCDRRLTYPRLSSGTTAMFVDRFTGAGRVVGGQPLRDFMELTAANELDIADHNPTFVAEFGPDLLDLLTGTFHLLSAPAWDHCRATLRT